MIYSVEGSWKDHILSVSSPPDTPFAVTCHCTASIKMFHRIGKLDRLTDSLVIVHADCSVDLTIPTCTFL